MAVPRVAGPLLRPRDIADIGAILDAGHELDLTRIRGLLKVFTEALESDDFSAEFERLLTHHRRGS